MSPLFYLLIPMADWVRAVQPSFLVPVDVPVTNQYNYIITIRKGS